MSNPHASLLQTGRIGTMELKNRIVMAPMGENYGGTDGICGERAQDYYEERAQGGTGEQRRAAVAGGRDGGGDGAAEDDLAEGIHARIMPSPAAFARVMPVAAPARAAAMPPARRTAAPAAAG